jgi:hypothetical protein
MSKRYGLAAGLDVVGRLSVLTDDMPFQVDCQGSTIDVILPDLQTALRLRKRLSRVGRRAWATSLRSTMALSGLELRVWVCGRQVGRIAATSKRGWLAFWLGLDPFELSISALLAALVGRQFPAVVNPKNAN